MKSAVTSYQVLEPSFYQMILIWILRSKQENFLTNVLITSLRCFPAKCSRSKRLLEKDCQFKICSRNGFFLIAKNASLATTYPDVCTAYMMYMTVPVTVATAERSFSKLKLIKNFLRSSMSQERLGSLALLSIENEQAKNLDFRKVIQQFASAKVRRKNFKFSTTRK